MGRRKEGKMSEELPTMVTDEKDSICMIEFVIITLYFAGFINRKTYIKESKKNYRKWNQLIRRINGKN
jgi:hypothetical protein